MMRLGNVWCLVAITILFLGEIKLIKGNEHSKLKDVEDRFWDWQLSVNPEYSTFYGWTKYNDLSYNYSIGMFNESRVRVSEFHSQLLDINRGLLATADQVNYDILNDSFTTFLDGNKYGSLSTINFLGGLHLQWCPPFAATRTKDDFENYIARLNAARIQVEDLKEAGRLAISLNRTLHNVSLLRVPDQIDTNIFNKSESSPCYGYLQNLLNDSSISEEDREYIREKARNATKVYIDAFRDLKDFIVNEYMPQTRSEYGVYAWDPSHEYYRECIRWHLSFDMTPEEVHETGLREVERINGEMVKIMRRLGFNGSVTEFFKNLVDDPRFYTNDTDKILEDYKHVVFERIKPKLSVLFKDIPNIPLEVVRSTSDGIGGGYSKASDNRPGRFIINLYRPWELPSFEMMALSLHEADPGHHMQHSYSLLADMADFRKSPIFSFSQVPNWIPFYSAYSEGWGLYSEYLGEEMGLYEDDYEM